MFLRVEDGEVIMEGVSNRELLDEGELRYHKPMKLYLARHGRTNYNDLDLCNSDPSVDVHLTAEGTMQAKVLAEKLREVDLDRIIVSQLRRTRQTADIVNQFHGVAVEVDPLLNDHRSGFEGKPAKLLLDAMNAADNRWTVRFNNGESIEDVRKRMATFLGKLKAESYDAVLVVTSGWVIRVAVGVIADIPTEAAWKVDADQGDYLKFDM